MMSRTGSGGVPVWRAPPSSRTGSGIFQNRFWKSTSLGDHHPLPEPVLDVPEPAWDLKKLITGLGTQNRFWAFQNRFGNRTGLGSNIAKHGNFSACELWGPNAGCTMPYTSKTRGTRQFSAKNKSGLFPQFLFLTAMGASREWLLCTLDIA